MLAHYIMCSEIKQLEPSADDEGGQEQPRNHANDDQQRVSVSSEENCPKII